MTSSAQKILAVSGGVGGAKLVLGLSHCLEPDQLTVIANTGDDFEHLGLKICPDIDTVLYTLADWNNKELGWGQVDESWQFLDSLGRLGGETWFNLGDRDLATHIVRTQLLNAGKNLTEVIAHLSEHMGIRHRVIPMTNATVSTEVHTKDGATLSFQHYFVRDRCEPEVTGFSFKGLENAKASDEFLAAIDDSLTAVVICPSNPFVSVDPILALPEVVTRIQNSGVPVLVVSNIVGGQALKGPAAKMMNELGMPQTALGVAQHYRNQYGDLISGFVLDNTDAVMRSQVDELGYQTLVTNTVMLSTEDKVQLATEVLQMADQLKSML